MTRKTPVPKANREAILNCIHQNCPNCGQKMWRDYDNFRTIRTLSGVVRINLKLRRCQNRDCERYHQVYRPEEEGSWALPRHEFGLDLIAYAGSLRPVRTSDCATDSPSIKRKRGKYLSKNCKQCIRAL